MGKRANGHHAMKNKTLEALNRQIRLAHAVGQVWEKHWLPLAPESDYLRRKRIGTKR